MSSAQPKIDMTQEEEEEETDQTSDQEEEEPKAKKPKASQGNPPRLPDSLKIEIVKVLSDNTPYRTSVDETTTYGKSYTSRTGMATYLHKPHIYN